jgi:hypothetical protein
MFSFSSRRLAAVLAVLVARSHGFVVPRPTPSRAFGTRLFSTANDEVASMRVGDIKKELESYGISTKSFLEKSELIDALTKARADGLKPKETRTSSSSSSTSAATENSSTSSADREERLKEELEKCNAMKASELKKELQELGVSTKSFFEKSEFAKALAEARVDGVKKSSASNGEEGYAEYANVEVITDDSTGPRQKQSQRQSESSSPFGGGGSPFGNAFGRNTPEGANPFGSMGSMGGLADMLKNLGGVGGAGGGDPFGGANPFAGGGSPFGGMGGGMGDVMGKAQEMMKNPKVMEIIAKAQSNPRVMKAVQECMSNPAAMAKYQNDPEISSLLKELKKYM